MHAIAIDLQRLGNVVTGSDDAIFEPSRSLLSQAGLLPETIGWHAGHITPEIDVVVLGMHAQLDNPELLKAQSLGLEIVSFPELLGQMTADSHRVVVAGSHGKTTISAMIVHLLHKLDITFDHALGAQIAGLSSPVRLTGADLVIIEGDEYLSSRLDPVSKFLHYHPQELIITGIAWDHVNVFPTMDDYVAPFEQLVTSLSDVDSIIYYSDDQRLLQIVENSDAVIVPYTALARTPDGDLQVGDQAFRPNVFGDHNDQNLAALWTWAQRRNISAEQFCQAMSSFSGAARRLQLIRKEDPVVYQDYAHAPSKLKATTAAVQKYHAGQVICAIYELHTYSSMDPAFVRQYRDHYVELAYRIIFYDEEAVKLKRRQLMTDKEIREGFALDNIVVLRSADEITDFLKQHRDIEVLLLMSSGSLGGLDLEGLFA